MIRNPPPHTRVLVIIQAPVVHPVVANAQHLHRTALHQCSTAAPNPHAICKPQSSQFLASKENTLKLHQGSYSNLGLIAYLRDVGGSEMLEPVA